jgi:hypothetical protein
VTSSNEVDGYRFTPIDDLEQTMKEDMEYKYFTIAPLVL